MLIEPFIIPLPKKEVLCYRCRYLLANRNNILPKRCIIAIMSDHKDCHSARSYIRNIIWRKKTGCKSFLYDKDIEKEERMFDKRKIRSKYVEVNPCPAKQ